MTDQRKREIELATIVAPHQWYVMSVSHGVVMLAPDEGLEPANYRVVEATLRLAGYDLIVSPGYFILVI